jgi:GNAT superfamily N-acetyltransferase
MQREERIMLDAYRCVSDVTELDGVTVLTVPEAPASPMLNRIVGLGVDRPATEDDVDRALAAIPRGITFYVGVAPTARPRDLGDWLRARGLEPGWGWMAFGRGVEDLPLPETALTLVDVDSPGLAAAFARIVRVGYGLPEAVEPRVARAPKGGWQCRLALDGDEPAGAAGLVVSEQAAYLGFAATLPEHRGKGAQNALLATRIRRALEQGCEVVLTETGERRDDLPSNSYRNILRAGFEERGVTANWVGSS